MLQHFERGDDIECGRRERRKCASAPATARASGDNRTVAR
jgi:hypothetical protein